MTANYDLRQIATNWSTILGDQPQISEAVQHRELWQVTADDGRMYYLKRLGPWRDYPLADEARLLRHLARSGVPVAEFIPTESAMLYAGEIEDCFILIPKLPHATLSPVEILGSEAVIGNAMAAMHQSLATYPWPANSHPENLCENLLSDLMLPPDIAGAYSVRRNEVVARIASLPVQNVHGDMSPENILLAAIGEVSGFIDFDHLPIAPRVWDVGKYLSRRLRPRWQANATTRTNPLDHIREFLKGYQTRSSLSEIEVAGLPATILAGNVLEVSYQLEVASGRLPRRILPDHDDVTADAIAAARWHLEHWDDVIEALGTAKSGG
ncbi:MAG: phosphotransferase [Thermomicrobiales bacterium]|nr:phosphotransferase [Thermomicrobiales bacterium]